MAQTRVAGISVAAHAGTTQVLQAGLAALLGIALFIGVAFSQPSVIHNAAHDSRHGISVPCH